MNCAAEESCCCTYATMQEGRVVAGSANINMRSLAGTRDTEIAATLWQPNHMRQLMPGVVSMPRGQVHGFRMSLWKEHLGNVTPAMEDTLRDPGSLACSRLIQNCAKVCTRCCTAQCCNVRLKSQVHLRSLFHSHNMIHAGTVTASCVTAWFCSPLYICTCYRQASASALAGELGNFYQP